MNEQTLREEAAKVKQQLLKLPLPCPPPTTPRHRLLLQDQMTATIQPVGELSKQELEEGREWEPEWRSSSVLPRQGHRGT